MTVFLSDIQLKTIFFHLYINNKLSCHTIISILWVHLFLNIITKRLHQKHHNLVIKESSKMIEVFDILAGKINNNNNKRKKAVTAKWHQSHTWRDFPLELIWSPWSIPRQILYYIQRFLFKWTVLRPLGKQARTQHIKDIKGLKEVSKQNHP